MTLRFVSCMALCLGMLASCSAAAGAPSVPSGTSAKPSVAVSTSATPAALAGGDSARPSRQVRLAAEEPAPSPSASRTAEVFFTTGARLVSEPRAVDPQHPARDAVDALLQGPREPEHYSEIPPATRLRSINMKDGVAYVDLTDDFFASGGSTGSTLRLAQLVFTLTQFPSIRSVQVLDEGYKRDVLGGEGFPIAGPLSRDDFRNLA